MGQEAVIWATILQSRIVRWIGTAIAAVAAVLTFGAIKRREGVKDERAAEAQREVEALQRGAKGAAEGKAKLRTGETPQEVKNENDRKWR